MGDHLQTVPCGVLWKSSLIPARDPDGGSALYHLPTHRSSRPWYLPATAHLAAAASAPPLAPPCSLLLQVGVSPGADVP